jgi:hypothetical protein
MLRWGSSGRRNLGVVAVHIGAERVRHDSGIERLTCDAIREVTAVTDVDLEAMVDRGANNRVHFALSIDEAAGMPREWMRENIARPQLRNDPGCVKTRGM